MPIAIQEGQYESGGDIIVGPGDCRFSTDQNYRLITRGLQSCIAIAVHAPKLAAAALLRFSVPGLSLDAPASAVAPTDDSWMFAETAIPLLFARLRAMGAANQDLSVYAVGGSTGAKADGSSVSGKSNELAMRRLLWREGVLLNGEDTGGTCSRSVWLDASGRIIVRTQSCAAPAVARLSRLTEAYRSERKAAIGIQPCHFAS